MILENSIQKAWSLELRKEKGYVYENVFWVDDFVFDQVFDEHANQSS